MKKIHLILNAHIDPVWLWPWEASLDELLATCRSACDRLDAHPDIVFTRGEAWVYRQVEMLDPLLFSRIREHIQAGRWEIVGGWWIQPDCNQPSGWAFQKQIALGKQYFQDTFGSFPRIGYNVDSFGHAATLPALMREAGQDRYIMMRPQEHELILPARLFRWRGYENGPEVLTFRIANGYTTRVMELAHIQTTITNLPGGTEHTMAFVGVGDHGGGPTEMQIAWCREHARDIDGWEMIFSSPSRFFDAVAGSADHLPLVTGELQMHAIGCYSVYRPIKTKLRHAEHRMAQAEFAASDPAAIGCGPARLREGWEKVCFNQFHDTLGGTCLPSAYPAALDQLGLAACIADEALQFTLRRKLSALPADHLQRIVLWNSSPQPFSGFVEFEPWLEWNALGAGAGLLDETGNALLHQFMEQEATSNGLQRVLFRIALEPGEMTAIKIMAEGAAAAPSRVTAGENRISNNAGIAVTPTALDFNGIASQRPSLELIQDDSDTWSHGLDRYSNEIVAAAKWTSRQVVDRGPLMASWIERGTIGDAGELIAEWRVYADEPFASLDLTVDFRDPHRLLKLTFPLNGQPQSRLDGILGGSLTRPNDGRELPLRDWTLLGDQGAVCPDVYACDATPERLRMTLLRSPLMAHHEPHSGEPAAARVTVADMGRHRFRFRFYGPGASAEVLEASAITLERPPVIADLTRGMTARQ